MKNNLHSQSATELVAAMAAGKISAVELMQFTISRIEKYDEKINSVVVRDFEAASYAAKMADAAIARGERKPLLGLPVTVKESFSVAGLQTTWGNPQFKDWIPEQDAVVISRLKAAGAIIIGKTNVPFMLQDWQSYNDLYGTTNNPWNLNYTSGGSSGGSAAALAAGFVSLELGSDLAGSIRVPASYCGIMGHKPSANLIPTRGASPPNTPPSTHALADFAVIGPMARSAADLELGLKILAAPDEMWDGKGYKLFLPVSRKTALKDYRVLILDQHPLCTTASAIKQSFSEFATKLEKIGAKVTYDLPAELDLAEVTRIYVTLFAAFVAGNMPLAQYQNYLDRAKQLEDHDQSIEACFLRGCGLSYRDWMVKTRLREILRPRWRKLFENFDVVLCPVMPTVALPHDHCLIDTRKIEIDGKFFSYNEQFSWVSLATLFGLPVTVMPINLTDNGLPVGMQIIGDYLEDLTTIQFANLFTQEFGNFPMPEIYTNN